MCGGHSGTGDVLHQTFQFSFVNHHSINTPHNIYSETPAYCPRMHRHPHLAPKKIWEQKCPIIQYFELPQPSIYRQKWRCRYIGVRVFAICDRRYTVLGSFSTSGFSSAPSTDNSYVHEWRCSSLLTPPPHHQSADVLHLRGWSSQACIVARENL